MKLLYWMIWAVVVLFLFTGYGFAQDVTVSWDPNTEADLLGYKVYYGTASRSYDHVIDVENVVEHQVTDLSLGQTYYFAVTAYDTAYNESDYSEEVYITLKDTTQNSDSTKTPPPTITDAITIDLQTIRVYFSQEMDENSISNPNHYSIDPSVQIVSIEADTTLMFVTITTSTHQQETDYTLTVDNIENSSGVALLQPFSFNYRFSDTNPPFVSGIHLVDLSTIRVSFSEEMNEQSVQNKDHYTISPALTIHQIDCLDSKTEVILHTDAHSSSTNYTLTIQGVKDLRENVLANAFSISYSFSDQTPPEVVSVTVENRTTLHCYFSKKMDYSSVADSSHYTIQPSVEIYDIMVDSTLQKVTLRTDEHQSGVPYELIVSGVKDFSQEEMTSSYQYSYSFSNDESQGPPATPPSITDVIFIDLQTIRVYFSQKMDRVSITHADNYNISPQEQIVSIHADSSLMYVVITTSTHQIGTNYTLTIHNVKNVSDIPISQPYTKRYHYPDNVPPFITGIHLVDLDTIQVSFSEPMEAQTVEDENHYQISPNLTIHQIGLNSSLTRATLYTDPHSGSVDYTLTIQGVKDQAENELKNPFSISYSFSDQSPPEVVEVETLNRKTLLCSFSEKMDYASITDKEHYDIQPAVEIYDVVVDTSLKKATLRTEEHQAQVDYQLTISDVKDFSQIGIEEPYTYSYKFSDTMPPYVEKMELVSPTCLKLYFSEKMDSSGFTVVENFTIEPSVQINSVQTDTSCQSIVLNTETHQYRIEYILGICDVCDLASNEIPENYELKYEFRRSATVDSINIAGYQPTMLAEGDQYYNDRDYQLASIPEELKELTWVKTSNNDKFSTGDDFLQFHVQEDVVVYIGYDQRISKIPTWLQEWSQTTMVVSDNNNTSFRCYSKSFSEGKVLLGGNYGTDQSNMYICMVKCLNHAVQYPPPPAKNSENNKDIEVTEFELLQNYPNPFNPITEIPFVANTEDHITLKIYDILGRLIRTFEMDVTATGQYKFIWNGTNRDGIPVGSGIYLYCLQTPSYQKTKKMTLIR